MKQFTVFYETFGQERQKSFSVETEEDALATLHRAYPGIQLKDINEVRETTPPAADERKWQAAAARIGKINSRPTTDDETDLFSKAETRVRFLWAERLDGAVRQRFVELGRSLPLEAQPIETGKNGGTTELYSLSCDVFLPVPERFDTAVFPNAKVEKGILHIYDLALGLELFCNQGFTGVFKGVETEAMANV
jgi:hypothetical protein